MLRLRICPNCQEEIRSPKAYFCHRCGAELPSPKIEETPSVEVESRVEDKLVKKRRLVVVVAATLVVALCFAVGGGVYYFYSLNKTPLLPQADVPKNEAFVNDLSFGIENHPLSAKGLSEIVPAEVDLYLESINPEILLPSLISPDNWSGIEAVFSERIELSAAEAASFLEDEFAFIQESTASAFLAKARDVDFLEQKLVETEDLPAVRQGTIDWKAKVVEGFLVISNSPDLIHAIEEAQKKLSLNLSLTSGFAEARKGLPKTGQIFVCGKKRLEFVPDEVKGEAFVVSKKDNGVLVTGL